VEVVGETVLTPEVGTSPIPSMETLDASAVRQLRTTWSPAEMLLGVAVICATGAGAAAEVAAGAVEAVDGGGVGFLEQPAIATRATTRTTKLKARNCRFKGVLLRVNSETGFQHSTPTHHFVSSRRCGDLR
jgi:hypothetical protein